MKIYEPHSSSLGRISANLLAAAAYVAATIFGVPGIIACLVLYFSEKNSGFVKFHAMQALSLLAVRKVIFSVLSALGIFNFSGLFSAFDFAGIMRMTENIAGSMFKVGIGVLFGACGVVGAINAYRWREWRVPVLGQFAQRLCAKGAPALYNGDGPVPAGCERGALNPQQQAGDNDAPQNHAVPPPPPPPPSAPLLPRNHQRAAPSARFVPDKPLGRPASPQGAASQEVPPPPPGSIYAPQLAPEDGGAPKDLNV